MTQYIITEEELGGIIDITEDMCIQEGWVKEVVPLAQKRMSIINKVRSRPYQSERDKVLDETSNGVILWSPAHIFRLICRLNETEFEYLLSDIRWLQERDFKKKYPELRQAGES